MNRKVIACLLALCLTLSVLPVLAEDANIVRVGMGYDPNTLDYAEVNLDSANFVIEATAETLIRDIGNDQYVPGLAESWEKSEDAKTWTFHIREGLTYQDGETPITAEDFRYNLMRTIDPEAAHGNASFFIAGALAYYEGEGTAEDVGVKVIDDYTIEYTFENPAYESTFTSVSLFGALEQAYVEQYPETWGASAEAYLANGPYMVKEWVSDASVSLVKNPAYYNPSLATLDEIRVIVGATGDTGVDMMLAGELDIADFTKPQQIQTLTDAGFEVKFDYIESYQGLNVNHAGKTEETGKFLGNANFLTALNLALNREAMVLSVRQGELPANRLTAPSEAAYAANPDYEAWPTAGDPALAKEYLDKALEELGVTLDEVPTFGLMCFEAQGSIDTLAVVQDMWLQTLGIKTEIEAVTIQVMIGNAMSGQYDFWLGGNSPSVPDACESYLTGFTTANYTPLRGYSDPTFDALYNKTVAATSLEERYANYAELEKYFCENVLGIITTWTVNYEIAPANYGNFYVTSGGNLNVSSLTK
ncbi:MAG: peptide ABC transporter substrate-binding protein [Clostridia bacterium]|nr:peptide ABC transporter substrate-binding protein [Clostridia bacterium]